MAELLARPRAGAAATSCARGSVERAEGVPLYAVETVRMLLDRGLLVERGERLLPAGPSSTTLAVPETLHALIAARLDALAAAERRLRQARRGARARRSRAGRCAALTAGRTPRSSAVLAGPGRARRCCRSRRGPALAGAGQYGFLQDLVRRVAYETLSKRDGGRAPGGGLEDRGRGRGCAEVLAGHYLAAVRADPDAADAAEIARRAVATLRPAATAGVVAWRPPRGAPLLRAGGGVAGDRSSRPICSSMRG